jgi:uncharacterized ion transporter superfamily protein YfcC
LNGKQDCHMPLCFLIMFCLVNFCAILNDNVSAGMFLASDFVVGSVSIVHQRKK